MKIYSTKYLIIFVLSLLFIIQSKNYAQISQYRFSKLDINDGLSQSLVYDIHQCQDGFMWFGTADGLNRYDGYKFQVYHHNPFDSTSISANTVTHIHEDDEGRLWIIAGGLNLLSKIDESFQLFDLPNKENYPNEVVTAITSYSNSIIVGTSFGRILKLIYNGYREATLTKVCTITDKTKAKVDITNIKIENSEVIWIATDIGLFNLSIDDIKKNNKVEPKLLKFIPDDLLAFTKGMVHDVIIDGEILWVGVPNHLLKYDRLRNKLDSYLIKKEPHSMLWMNNLKDIEKVFPNEIWVSTFDGLGIFNIQTEEFSVSRKNATDPFSLSANNTTAIFKDKSDLVWVGTGGAGLNKYSRFTSQFNYYPFAYNKNPYSSIRKIIVDKYNNIWAFNTDMILLHQNKENVITNQNQLFNSDYSLIHDMKLDKKDNIWFSFNNSIISYNITSKRISKYSREKEYGNTIIYLDSDDNIWNGANNLISKIDPSSHSFNATLLNGIDSNITINCLVKSNNGLFWIGSDEGLIRYNMDKSSLQIFEHNSKAHNSLSSNNISSLLFDPFESDSILWVGTKGGGLNKFNTNTFTSEYFIKKDGLSSNYIYEMLSDSLGNLWISTNFGLSNYLVNENNFISYTFEDGLQSNEFNASAAFKDYKGILYFGGVKGVTSFNPQKISKNIFIPDVIITDFHINHNSIVGQAKEYGLPKPISQVKEIELDYNQNDLKIYFAAQDYTVIAENSFVYKLENHQENWVQLGKQNFVHFINLSPGKYNFLVTSINNKNFSKEFVTSLKIIILPAIWDTWLAKLLYFIIGIVLLYTIFRYEIKRRELKISFDKGNFQIEKLKELDQLKTKFFTGVSHEFRTPLTLILGNVEKLELEELSTKVKQKLDSIKRNGKSLLKFLNQLLDLSKIEADKMGLSVNKTELVSFLNNIVISFASIAENKGIELQFNSELKKLVGYIDREKVIKIMNNLLSNAIKFTNTSGYVHINVRDFTTPDPNSKIHFLEINVKDSGIGIEESQIELIFDYFHQISIDNKSDNQGSGIGLSLVRELLSVHRGSVDVESKKGVGTNFKILIPINLESYLESEFEDNKKVAKKNEIDNVQSEEGGFDQEKRNENGKIVEKIQVLVVEDHKEMRAFIVDSLNDNYIVLQASNGEEGIDIATENIPDIIISDIMMPKVSGLELTQSLKNDIRTSHIPIIILSAKSTDDDKLSGRKHGADFYLTKPFNSEELLTVIKNSMKFREGLQKKIKNDIGLKENSSKIEDKFITNLIEIIEENLEEEKFSVEVLSSKLALSISQLNRKIKAISSYTTIQFIQNYRLQKSKDLLKIQTNNITDVCFKIGFNSPAYFTKCFREQFGITPKEYRSRYIK